MPGWIGPGDLLVLLVVALLLFGPQKLPEIGRMLGKGIRDFKSSFESVGPDGGREQETASPTSNPQMARPWRERDTVG